MADITEKIVIPEVPRVLDGQELYVYIPKAAIFDLNIEKGTGNVLVQTTDPDHSFKVMTDGRAKVKSAPVESDDVVRKLDLELIIPNIMSEQPFGFRRLVGQTRKTEDDINKTSIYTIASEQAAIVPDRIPWYRSAGNPDSIPETPTATLPVCDPAWEFDAANKQYVDKKVDNDTDRIRCGDLYVAGVLGLIQAKTIQNPTRGNGVTVNDSLKVLVEPSQDTDVVRKKELDTKLDKAGGTISGSLTVANDLTVQGKTTTVDTEHLKVTDKLIYVAKDNTVPLTSPAGLITPKYDGTNNGGIVYDSTGTAYVGDITLNSNGNIDVANSDLQPIATRDNNNNLTNGNLLSWDSANNKIIDSGKKVVQKAGIDTENVMSQKAVTNNLYSSGEETSLTWYRKSYTIYDDGKLYGDGYLDSTIRLANVDSHLVQGPDITNKMVTISVDSGYKYACVLYKDVSGVKQVTSYSDWKYYTEPTTWFANGEYKYLLIAIGKIDDSEILTTESSAIHIETFDSVKGQAENSVKYIAQSLTTGQQKLARDNIMAMPGKILGKYENKNVSFLKSDSFHLISNGITNVELFIGETSKFSKTSVMFLSFSLTYNGFIYLSGITYNDEVFHYNYAFQSADTYGWIKFTDGYGVVDIFGNTEVTLTNG